MTRIGYLSAVAGIAAIAGCGLWGTAANAATISIGLQENGGPITTVYTSTNGVISYANNSLPGYSITVGGSGVGVLLPPGLLFTGTVDAQNSAVPIGTQLALYVTEQGLTTSSPGFQSSFGVLGLTGGSLTEQTLYSASNALYSGTQIGSEGPVTGPLSANVFENAANPSPSGTYSVTEVYSGTTTASKGALNANIDIAATPLPAALPLFAGGLGLLGLLGRRKKRAIVA